MSNVATSSYSALGTNLPGSAGSAHSSHPSGAMAQNDGNIAPQLPVLPIEGLVLTPDKSVAEASIRRISKEIELAKQELQELDKTLVQEMLTPSVRGWLLPLMAVGLLLSLYGSIASSNSAELGATGLVLLWSLSAFWFLYTGERRLEMAKKANRAEIEIWSSRIEELEKALEQTRLLVQSVGK